MKTTKEKIIELSEKWYEYVSQDHHKDGDCHWIIEVDFAYGEEPVYTAHHNGYIADDLGLQPSRTTYEEAEVDLLELIEKAIRDEREWVEIVLRNKNEYDEFQIKQAEKFNELF